MAISKTEKVMMVPLRLPLDMRAWLEKQAARSLASMNNEILRCIRARMDAAETRERISA